MNFESSLENINGGSPNASLPNYRWKRSPSGEKFERSKGSFSLEFLAMKRKEEIAIPGVRICVEL